MVQVQQLTVSEINNLNLSGSIVFNSTSNQLYYNDGVGNIFIIDNKIITDQIINFLSNVVLGAAQASKVLVLDSSKNISGINTLTLIQPLAETSGGTGKNNYTIGDILVTDSSSTLTKLPKSAYNGDFLTTDTLSSIGVSWNFNLLKKYVNFCDPVLNSNTSYFIEYLFTKLFNNLIIENKTINLATVGINGLTVLPNLSGTIYPDPTSTILTGTGTTFLTDFVVGDVINISNKYSRVTNITSDTSITIDSAIVLLNTWSLNGTAALSTSQQKFGTTSLNATNATAYAELITGSGSNFSALASAWTIEFFFYLTAVNANLAICASSQTAFSFEIKFANSGDLLLLSLGQGTTFNIANGSTIPGAIPINTWTHLAIVYTGTSYLLFKNGVLGLTINNSNKITSTAFNSFRFGGNGSSVFRGFIDEIRISNSARYVTTFTPTTSQFTIDSNTISLNHFENTTITNSDDASNNIQFNYYRNGKYYSNSMLYLYGLMHNTIPGYILSNRSNILSLVDLPYGYTTTEAIKLPFCIPIINNIPVNVYKSNNYISYYPYYNIVTNATNTTPTFYVLPNVIPNHCKLINIMVIHNHAGTTQCDVNIGPSNMFQSILTLNTAIRQTITLQIPIYNYDQTIQAYLSAVASTTSYTLNLIGIYF